MVAMKTGAAHWMTRALLGCAASTLLMGHAFASDRLGAALLASAGATWSQAPRQHWREGRRTR